MYLRTYVPTNKVACRRDGTRRRQDPESVWQASGTPRPASSRCPSSGMSLDGQRHPARVGMDWPQGAHDSGMLFACDRPKRARWRRICPSAGVCAHGSLSVPQFQLFCPSANHALFFIYFYCQRIISPAVHTASQETHPSILLSDCKLQGTRSARAVKSVGHIPFPPAIVYRARLACWLYRHSYASPFTLPHVQPTINPPQSHQSIASE